ncbi:MAG: hypothetical protein U9Q22_07400, partial [Candidatus Altiarchaeota archaeon]|nr:hypothetical protein [Candidatus Altiarchaeota archaeon]
RIMIKEMINNVGAEWTGSFFKTASPGIINSVNEIGLKTITGMGRFASAESVTSFLGLTNPGVIQQIIAQGVDAVSLGQIIELVTPEVAADVFVNNQDVVIQMIEELTPRFTGNVINAVGLDVVSNYLNYQHTLTQMAKDLTPEVASEFVGAGGYNSIEAYGDNPSVVTRMVKELTPKLAGSAITAVGLDVVGDYQSYRPVLTQMTKNLTPKVAAEFIEAGGYNAIDAFGINPKAVSQIITELGVKDAAIFIEAATPEVAVPVFEGNRIMIKEMINNVGAEWTGSFFKTASPGIINSVNEIGLKTITGIGEFASAESVTSFLGLTNPRVTQQIIAQGVDAVSLGQFMEIVTPEIAADMLVNNQEVVIQMIKALGAGDAASFIKIATPEAAITAFDNSGALVKEVIDSTNVEWAADFFRTATIEVADSVNIIGLKNIALMGKFAGGESVAAFIGLVKPQTLQQIIIQGMNVEGLGQFIEAATPKVAADALGINPSIVSQMISGLGAGDAAIFIKTATPKVAVSAFEGNHAMIKEMIRGVNAEWTGRFFKTASPGIINSIRDIGLKTITEMGEFASAESVTSFLGLTNPEVIQQIIAQGVDAVSLGQFMELVTPEIAADILVNNQEIVIQMIGELTPGFAGNAINAVGLDVVSNYPNYQHTLTQMSSELTPKAAAEFVRAGGYNSIDAFGINSEVVGQMISELGAVDAATFIMRVTPGVAVPVFKSDGALIKEVIDSINVEWASGFFAVASQEIIDSVKDIGLQNIAPLSASVSPEFMAVFIKSTTPEAYLRAISGFGIEDLSHLINDNNKFGPEWTGDMVTARYAVGGVVHNPVAGAVESFISKTINLNDGITSTGLSRFNADSTYPGILSSVEELVYSGDMDLDGLTPEEFSSRLHNHIQNNVIPFIQQTADSIDPGWTTTFLSEVNPEVISYVEAGDILVGLSRVNAKDAAAFMNSITQNTYEWAIKEYKTVNLTDLINEHGPAWTADTVTAGYVNAMEGVVPNSFVVDEVNFFLNNAVNFNNGLTSRELAYHLVKSGLSSQVPAIVESQVGLGNIDLKSSSSEEFMNQLDTHVQTKVSPVIQEMADGIEPEWTTRFFEVASSKAISYVKEIGVGDIAKLSKLVDAKQAAIFIESTTPEACRWAINEDGSNLAGRINAGPIQAADTVTSGYQSSLTPGISAEAWRDYPQLITGFIGEVGPKKTGEILSQVKPIEIQHLLGDVGVEKTYTFFRNAGVKGIHAVKTNRMEVGDLINNLDPVEVAQFIEGLEQGLDTLLEEHFGLLSEFLSLAKGETAAQFFNQLGIVDAVKALENNLEGLAKLINTEEGMQTAIQESGIIVGSLIHSEISQPASPMEGIHEREAIPVAATKRAPGDVEGGQIRITPDKYHPNHGINLVLHYAKLLGDAGGEITCDKLRDILYRSNLGLPESIADKLFDNEGHLHPEFRERIVGGVGAENNVIQVTSPEVDLAPGKKISIQVTLERHPVEIREGDVLYDTITIDGSDKIEQLKEKARDLRNLPEREKIVSVVDMVRETLKHPTDWGKEKLERNIQKPINLSEAVEGGICICNAFSALYSVLIQEAGLGVALQAGVAENIIRPDTNEKLFKVYDVGDRVQHAWDETELGDGSFIPVDPTTGVVGIDEGLDVFREARYREFARDNIKIEGLPEHVTSDKTELLFTPGERRISEPVYLYTQPYLDLDGEDIPYRYGGGLEFTLRGTSGLRDGYAGRVEVLDVGAPEGFEVKPIGSLDSRESRFFGGLDFITDGNRMRSLEKASKAGELEVGGLVLALGTAASGNDYAARAFKVLTGEYARNPKNIFEALKTAGEAIAPTIDNREKQVGEFEHVVKGVVRENYVAQQVSKLTKPAGKGVIQKTIEGVVDEIGDEIDKASIDDLRQGVRGVVSDADIGIFLTGKKQKITVSTEWGCLPSYEITVGGKSFGAMLVDDNGNPVTKKAGYKKDIGYIRDAYGKGRLLLSSEEYRIDKSKAGEFWSQIRRVTPAETAELKDSTKGYVGLNPVYAGGVKGSVYGWTMRDNKTIYKKGWRYYLPQGDYNQYSKDMLTQKIAGKTSEIEGKLGEIKASGMREGIKSLLKASESLSLKNMPVPSVDLGDPGSVEEFQRFIEDRVIPIADELLGVKDILSKSEYERFKKSRLAIKTGHLFSVSEPKELEEDLNRFIHLDGFRESDDPEKTAALGKLREIFGGDDISLSRDLTIERVNGVYRIVDGGKTYLVRGENGKLDVYREVKGRCYHDREGNKSFAIVNPVMFRDVTTRVLGILKDQHSHLTGVNDEGVQVVQSLVQLYLVLHEAVVHNRMRAAANSMEIDGGDIGNIITGADYLAEGFASFMPIEIIKKLVEEERNPEAKKWFNAFIEVVPDINFTLNHLFSFGEVKKGYVAQWEVVKELKEGKSFAEIFEEYSRIREATVIGGEDLLPLETNRELDDLEGRIRGSFVYPEREIARLLSTKTYACDGNVRDRSHRIIVDLCRQSGDGFTKQVKGTIRRIKLILPGIGDELDELTEELNNLGGPGENKLGTTSTEPKSFLKDETATLFPGKGKKPVGSGIGGRLKGWFKNKIKKPDGGRAEKEESPGSLKDTEKIGSDQAKSEKIKGEGEGIESTEEHQKRRDLVEVIKG